MKNTKAHIKHVGDQATAVPVTPRDEWPQFPEPAKPSAQSAFKTVLWFHQKTNNGVRVIVEGRDKATVEAYARMIAGA